MKKLILAILLAISITNYAQEKTINENKESKRELKSPEERQAMHLKKMTENLNLNAKQQEEIKQLMSERKAKGEEIRAMNKNEMLEKRNAMEAKMKAILTPEQFEKWNSQKEKRKEQFKKRHEMMER